MAIVSYNSTEFKNEVLNDACDEIGIKMLYFNPFHPQGNAKVENVHEKGPLPYSWTIVILSGMNYFHLFVIAIPFPGSNGTKSPSFHMFG